MIAKRVKSIKKLKSITKLFVEFIEDKQYDSADILIDNLKNNYTINTSWFFMPSLDITNENVDYVIRFSNKMRIKSISYNSRMNPDEAIHTLNEHNNMENYLSTILLWTARGRSDWFKLLKMPMQGTQLHEKEEVDHFSETLNKYNVSKHLHDHIVNMDYHYHGIFAKDIKSYGYVKKHYDDVTSHIDSELIDPKLAELIYEQYGYVPGPGIWTETCENDELIKKSVDRMEECYTSVLYGYKAYAYGYKMADIKTRFKLFKNSLLKHANAKTIISKLIDGNTYNLNGLSSSEMELVINEAPEIVTALEFISDKSDISMEDDSSIMELGDIVLKKKNNDGTSIVYAMPEDMSNVSIYLMRSENGVSKISYKNGTFNVSYSILRKMIKLPCIKNMDKFTKNVYIFYANHDINSHNLHKMLPT